MKQKQLPLLPVANPVIQGSNSDDREAELSKA